MFSKNKETDTVATPTPPAQTKRSSPRNGVPSIISSELMVRGTLVSAGDVQIDGKVDGDVRAASLVIGEKAVIVGDVFAEEATVRGRVEGSIRAHKVQLCATCHVEGNILHEALSVETGAFFEGNCRHSDNPLADAPEVEMPAPAERKHAAAERERKSAQSQHAPLPPKPAAASVASAAAAASKPPH